MSCVEAELWNSTDKCAYVTENCHGESVVNLYQLYFCALNMNNFIATPLAVRVTLLALGNGACDMIAGFIASGGESEGGMSVSIGSYLGSMMIVTGFVCPMVIFFSTKDVKMPKKIFLKDMLFLLLCYLLLVLFAIVGELNVPMAIMMVVMYIGYIILVVLMEYRQNKKTNKPKKEDESTMGIEIPVMAIKAMPKEESAKLVSDDSKIDNVLKESHITAEDLKDLVNRVEYHSTSLSKFKYNFQWRLYKLKMLVYDSYKNEEWKHMKWYSKILYVPIGALFNALMKISIPPTGEDTWDRRFASLCPVFGFAFLVFLFKLYYYPLFALIGMALMLILSLAIYCTTHRHIPPFTIVVFSFFSFAMSLLWLYFLASVILDIFEIAIIITEVDDSYIGLTFLAIGNSVADIVAEISISMIGYTEMAMVGAFAGPIFLILVGLPTSIVPHIISSGEPAKFNILSMFDLKSDEMLLMIALVFNIFALLVFIYLTIKNNYLIEKFMGKIELILYGIFFALVSVLTVIKQLFA